MTWNYRKYGGLVTYTTDINTFACVVEGWDDGPWKWYVYEDPMTHHYGGTPESAGEEATIKEAMAAAESYATAVTR